MMYCGSGGVGIRFQRAHFIGSALGGAVSLGTQLAYLAGSIVQLVLYAVLPGNRNAQRYGRSDHKDAQYGDQFFHGTDSSFNCFGGSIIRGRFAVPPVRLTLLDSAYETGTSFFRRIHPAAAFLFCLRRNQNLLIFLFMRALRIRACHGIIRKRNARYLYYYKR